MFSSMCSSYSVWLMINASLIAEWLAGVSISAFPLGVLGSIPSENLFLDASQLMSHSNFWEFFGHDYSNVVLCLHAIWGSKSFSCRWSSTGVLVLKVATF